MRNFLFVPGNSPKMLSSANFLGSDAVVIDLEDAVAPGEKDAARVLVRNAIETFHYQVKFGVRINALDTPYWEKDLKTILPLKPDFIMLPKTADDASIFRLETAMAAIEAAHGVSQPQYHRVSELANRIFKFWLKLFRFLLHVLNIYWEMVHR